MESFDGYLFSKLDKIGTRAEGPKYFLQPLDYKEIVVIKTVFPWEKDPKLSGFLNKKVTIEGKLKVTGIAYDKISDYVYQKEDEKKEALEIVLKLGMDILWVNKMPGPSTPSQYMDLTLLVKWPYRGTWEGYCPTTQLYDFWIEKKEAIIWKWSNDKTFSQIIIPVSIPGGPDFHQYYDVWKINPDNIASEGVYTARAPFIASGQEVSKDFEIKYAQK